MSLRRRKVQQYGPLANGVPDFPEPIGDAGITRLAGYNIAEYSGLGGGGYPHYGMKGDPMLTYSGLVATPQQFQGQVQMGKARGVSVQEYAALPSDSAPPAVVQWLPDWTASLEGTS